MKINLEFLLDKNIILSRVLINEVWKLFSHERNCTDKQIYKIVKLIQINEQKQQNYKSIKREIDKIQFIYLNYENREYSLSKIFEKKIHNGKKVYELLEEYKETLFFSKILKDTEEYKIKLKNNWNMYLDITEQYLTEIIGTEITDIKGKVYIMPSEYNSGEAILNTKNVKIIYGNTLRGEVPELDVVYFMHELLHNPVLKYDNLKSIIEIEKLHAIIQYIAEEEFYYRITGIPYFKHKNIHEKHEELMIKLYPYWIGYLYKNKQESLNNIKKAIERDEMKMYDPKKIHEFFKMGTIHSIYDLIRIDLSMNSQFYYA